MALPPDPIIRPILLQDAEALWKIARQEGVLETTMALPSLRLEQRMKSISELSENDHYMVAERAGEVVGIAGLTVGTGRTRHSGSLFIYVARQQQGQGIGTRLMQSLLDLADNWLLLRRVELTVLTENEGAKRLYERLGFVVEGCNCYFLISPRMRSRDIETGILDWAEQQMRETGNCTAIDIPCRDTDTERVALLERHGFVRQEMQTLYMTRPLSEPIPSTVFPEGFTLRPATGEQELEAIVALHQEAFGTQNMTIKTRRAIMSNPAYMPELDLLLEAPDGTLAAFCYCTIPQEANELSGRNEGEIAIMGTSPAFQKRGLGRAMLLAGLQRLKDFGVEMATLGTSSENGGAHSVYFSAGFRVSYRSLWYAKSIW